ncbi:protein LURP-one-related 11-like [Phoenix dactylifera]|uniref:Protein LURP-one-related 11-like n=1 Tax=Phoenix dactylifera TaxID=42345 RepID=A0A8B7CKX8_PHODC|nr:protein LURP-one-related 11-like [Phoenix dactylifera]
MEKVHPSLASLPLPSLLDHISSEREVFTIWMKSLVFHGNGCTVYDSRGNIVYRVDNYDCKCSGKVYLMDLSGKVLFKILRKKFRVCGRWEGYKCYSSQNEESKPWFKVRKPWSILRDEQPSCEVWSDEGALMCYKIDGLASKSSYKIVDISSGLIVAEVKRKQTTSGILLGDDVLTLMVEPNIDHSLIMGLVVVNGLMNHNM